MNRLIIVSVVSVAVGFASSTNAAIQTFVVPLSGAQEAPGPGDPDGTGLATLRIDDLTLMIEWDITAANILFPLTGAHIHQAPAGSPGPIVVDFSAQLSGAGLADADLAGVVANPTNYYVNLHNADFTGGAIRGQLSAPIPEPGSCGTWLVLAGSLGTCVIRRGRKRTS